MGLVHRNDRNYFYRSVRRGGLVTSEYRGSGLTAVLLAQVDAIKRQEDAVEKAAEMAERERMETEERQAVDMFNRVESLAEAAMVVAGYRRHKGRWRKSRG